MTSPSSPSRSPAPPRPVADSASGPDAEASLPTRVILVGRTGLEAALRRDPGIELRRAKTTVEAIGELADSDGSPASGPAAVVVGADVDRGLGEESDQGGGAPEFIEGLQLIDPDVRVLAVDRDGSPAAAPYHGGVTNVDPARQIRAAVQAVQRTPAVVEAPAEVPAEVAAEPATARPAAVAHTETSPPEPARPAAPITPAVSAGAGAATGAGAGAGGRDTALLAAIMTGRDLLLPAMEIIRRELASPDVIYIPAEDGAAPDDPPAVGGETGHDPVQVPVSYRGRTFGWLSSTRGGPAAAADLLAPAGWLAHWLALRDQQEQLRTAAFIDDLTGAYNRRYFDRFLSAAIEHARAERLPVTVLYFDIDDFKHYNDRYGHGAGDDILRETVRLLRSVIRPTDRVCRIGGDEFAVIFQDPKGPRDPASKPPSTIRDIAQRFQRQICEHRFPKLAEQAPGPLTISGGLATYPWDGDAPEKLLHRADELAIQSKRQGKNAITLGPGAERICT